MGPQALSSYIGDWAWHLPGKVVLQSSKARGSARQLEGQPEDLAQRAEVHSGSWKTTHSGEICFSQRKAQACKEVLIAERGIHNLRQRGISRSSQAVELAGGIVRELLIEPGEEDHPLDAGSEFGMALFLAVEFKDHGVEGHLKLVGRAVKDKEAFDDVARGKTRPQALVALAIERNNPGRPAGSIANADANVVRADRAAMAGQRNR